MMTATAQETRNDAKMRSVLRTVNAALLGGWSIEFCGYCFESYWFGLFDNDGAQVGGSGSLFAMLESAFIAPVLKYSETAIVVDDLDLYLEVEQLVKDSGL